VVIVGYGPAGMFAALRHLELGVKPIILERGKDASARRFDLAPLLREGHGIEDSNYCFGEGGAGTFSDGKLYTRATKRGAVASTYETLMERCLLTPLGIPRPRPSWREPWAACGFSLIPRAGFGLHKPEGHSRAPSARHPDLTKQGRRNHGRPEPYRKMVARHSPPLFPARGGPRQRDARTRPTDSITWPRSLQESLTAPLEDTGETAGKSWENVGLWLSLNIDKTMLYDYNAGMSDRSKTTP
jgi:hypothetical protein